MEHHTLKSTHSDLLANFITDRLLGATKRHATRVCFHHARENLCLTFRRTGRSWDLLGWHLPYEAPSQAFPDSNTWVYPLWTLFREPIVFPREIANGHHRAICENAQDAPGDTISPDPAA